MDQVCFTSTAIPAFNAYSEELGTQNERWVWKLCKVLLQSLFKVTVLIPTCQLFVKLLSLSLSHRGVSPGTGWQGRSTFPLPHLVPAYLNTAARGSLGHAGH